MRIPLDTRPSYQRRAQQFPTGHWARVTPLPLAFPYRPAVPAVPENDGDGEDSPGPVDIEVWLGALEPRQEDWESEFGPKSVPGREGWTAELLGVSEACVEDCLPGLDVGNAGAYTAGETGNAAGPVGDLELDAAGRDLLDVVSGRKVLVGTVEGEKEYGPWSVRYAGEWRGCHRWCRP